MALQFSFSINNATAREALKDYAVTLQKAFQQHKSLWENYIKLQEIHEQCNTHFSVETANQIGELIPQKREENDNISTSITDKFHIDSPDNNINMESDLNESSCSNKDNNTPPNSPIFRRRCLKTVNSFMKKPKHSSQDKEATLSKCNKKLGISTTTHIETTFLPNGKKLKQSELIFQAVEPKKKKVSFNINKPKSINVERKIEHKSIDNDTLIGRESVIKKDNAMNTDEVISQDVIELSPKQRSVKCKVKDLLRDKKKFHLGQRIKIPSNKNKYYTPDLHLNMEDKFSIAHNNIDEANYTTRNQVKIHDFSIVDLNTVDISKENCNPSDLLLQKYNNRDIKTNEYEEIQKRNKIIKDEKQEICQNNSNNSTQENETLFPSVKNPAFEKQTDSFTLNYIDNAENKSPTKRMLFDNSNTLPKTKKHIAGHFNTGYKTEKTGHDCWECKSYYKSLPLQKEELQKRKNQCSRHRYKYPKPRSPEGFWNPEFSDSILSPH